MAMEWWCLITALFILQTFCPSESSTVKLVDGGYEDIVIAIHPELPEDDTLVEKIKDMVNDATYYLYNATQKRLFIRSAKILIPYTWSRGNYTKKKTETYDQADVIIAKPYLKYGDDPYTLQYGGCGDPGKYIHFTPTFLLNDTLLSVYGPRGRVFVHEWAHLRWGVFDEYNHEKPFYIASDVKPEATRCSRDILGQYVKQTDPSCEGDSCKFRACYFDNNGLYEEGCMFVFEKNQFARQSIMYSQALPSVFEFCNASNHNIEAPTLQNKMCKSRSTWEVIMMSSDINSTSPKSNASIPTPVISLIQYKVRVITLVLDVSGSMASYNRIQRLYQAAKIFLDQIIEEGSYVGIVTFSLTTTVETNLLQINGNEEREKLISLLPRTAGGGTDICKGILAGIEVNKQYDKSSHGTEIVLLSDGEDNYNTALCFSKIYESGAIIHFISLGPNYERSIQNIVTDTGGRQFSASDSVESTSLIVAFTGLSIGNGDILQQVIQLESTASILMPRGCLNGSIFIDSTVGNKTFFVVTWQNALLDIRLKDPKGTVYTAVNFTRDTVSKSSKLEILGTAEWGQWDYSLCNTNTGSQSLGIIVNTRAADENVPPVTVTAHMNTLTNTYPDPMVVYAVVSQGLLPVKGANVTAIIEPTSGEPIFLDLLDNGAGADFVKNDGVYSRYFTSFKTNGRYSLRVRVEGVKGKSRLAVRQSRTLHIPGYIENGKITLNPSRPTVEDDILNLGEFSRTSSGGAFEVTNIPSGVQRDVFSPERISDLEAKITNESITLVWTATGDDMDKGTASTYDLRMSTNSKELRDNFTGSSQVNMTGVIPKSAGSLESFTFVPENVAITNGTILFFALVAVDDVSLKSDISNIAQAALFIPPPADPTTTAPPLTQTEPTTTPNNSEETVPPSTQTEPTTTPNNSEETVPPSTQTEPPTTLNNSEKTVPPSTQTKPPTSPNNSEKMKASVISAIAYSVAVLICILT
ncbi:calcium-activated chloride channel regulator 1-like [Hyperolius riggenbachi]|uniref:calcium-activated chloride channel regulator 1-like n=1 Tax=Hyperolius riggenbachi TaxID=752182 RepID=UPI0035A2DC5B